MLVDVKTLQYQPFNFGGDLHGLIRCEVECEGPVGLGLGFEGWVFKHRDKEKWFVVELTSGGIVGSGITKRAALQKVNDDICGDGDVEYMKQQVAEEAERCSRARQVGPDEFFRSLG